MPNDNLETLFVKNLTFENKESELNYRTDKIFEV